MTAAEAAVDALIAEGTEVVFGMAGDTVLTLLASTNSDAA